MYRVELSKCEDILKKYRDARCLELDLTDGSRAVLGQLGRLRYLNKLSVNLHMFTDVDLENISKCTAESLILNGDIENTDDMWFLVDMKNLKRLYISSDIHNNRDGVLEALNDKVDMIWGFDSKIKKLSKYSEKLVI